MHLPQPLRYTFIWICFSANVLSRFRVICIDTNTEISSPIPSHQQKQYYNTIPTSIIIIVPGKSVKSFINNVLWNQLHNKGHTASYGEVYAVQFKSLPLGVQYELRYIPVGSYELKILEPGHAYLLDLTLWKSQHSNFIH